MRWYFPVPSCVLFLWSFRSVLGMTPFCRLLILAVAAAYGRAVISPCAHCCDGQTDKGPDADVLYQEGECPLYRCGSGDDAETFRQIFFGDSAILVERHHGVDGVGEHGAKCAVVEKTEIDVLCDGENDRRIEKSVDGVDVPSPEGDDAVEGVVAEFAEPPAYEEGGGKGQESPHHTLRRTQYAGETGYPQQ